MNKFLKKLVDNDCQIKNYTNNQEIIKQGLAPILANQIDSTTIQKANLLEQSKYLNWQAKAKVLFDCLNKHRIKFLVFKGFAYSFLLYDKSHIRPYSDIDILVQEFDYKKVEKLLQQLGYTLLPSRQGKFISFQNSFYDNNIPQTTIDLHWQINNRIEIHAHFQFSPLYLKAIDIDSPPFNFKSLNQIDAYLLACFHYQAHRPDDRKHIWLYDLALIWSNMDKETQNKCLQSAKKRQLTQIVNSILTQLKQSFTGCIEAQLEPIEDNEPSQEYLKHRNKKLTDIKNRLTNIKGLNNKIKYLSEYIFQSKSYVKNRYHTQSNVWVYFYYPRMWIEDILKLFKT